MGYDSQFDTVNYGMRYASAPKSKALGQNPKDLLGEKKVSMTKLPAVAIAHGAHAMMDGASKYGPYNWRDKSVISHIYVDAALRHVLDWFEGEEEAEDSGVHHLGHAIACCAILLDAQETGNLIDDRPVNDRTKAVLTRVLNRLNDRIKNKVVKNETAKTVENLSVARINHSSPRIRGRSSQSI